MINPQPSVYPFGIRIDEPIGTLTDVIVAIGCLYFFFQLNRRKIPGRAQLYLQYYFLFMGVATFLGGVTGHGFLYALGFAWKLPGWTIGIISVALLERSAIAHARPLLKRPFTKFFLVLNVIELIIVIAITMITLDFKWVGYHSVYGLLAIVSTFHGYTYYHTKDKGSLTILGGVLMTLLASIVFIYELSIHTWFNSLDISHTLLGVAAYMMYLGAIRLKKREGRRQHMKLEIV
jgi:hypothetical protein